jgi:hypothetical protein
MLSKAQRVECASESAPSANLPDLSAGRGIFAPEAAAAFFSYLLIALAIFGRALMSNSAAAYLGRGPDALLNIWFFGWWPHAIAYGLNPFESSAVWAPSGVNLAWTTMFPLASCVMFPITRLYGAVAASNIAHLIGLPLAGWSAFVLCRYLVRSFWPAWAGGCLFAFSPYMLTCMIGGGMFMLVFPIPLAVWMTLRRFEDKVGRRTFTGALALLLIAQFLLSVEIFATAALFGVIAIAFAARTAPSAEERARIISLVPWICAAYAISAVMISPYLYYMLALAVPQGVIFSAKDNAADLLNFLVPTQVNELGRVSIFSAGASHFRADLSESRAYLGLPMLLIAWSFAREHWREWGGKLLVFMFAAACGLAMGPFLEIAGRALVPLPGAGLAALPLIEKALPGRFMLYASLASSVLFSKWLQDEDSRPALRWGVGVAMVAFLSPNLSTSMWATPSPIPRFFSAGLYKHYIEPGQTVMVLPYGLFGEGDLWQAYTDFYFRMAGGYAGYADPIPEEHRDWPIMAGLYNVAGVPDADGQLKAYLANHNVSAVIVGPRTNYLVAWFGHRRVIDTWLLWPTIDRERVATDHLLEALGPPLAIGGIKLYRIAPQALTPYRNVTALEMQRRMARARFEALLHAAAGYINSGHEPALLSPELAQRSHLLPDDWFGGPVFTDKANPHYFHLKVVLSESHDGLFEIGIEGDYDTLEPIVRIYGSDANRIYFPYPDQLEPGPLLGKTAMMVMAFDRAGLERAAAVAK